MQPWMFNLMFLFMLAGGVFLLAAKPLGLTIDPTALTGYGAVTTYVLTQRGSWTKTDKTKKPDPGGP